MKNFFLVALLLASCEVPSSSTRREDPMLDKCSDTAHDCSVCKRTKQPECPECDEYDKWCKNRLRS